MRYVDQRLLYLMFQGFSLPVHSCDIPVNFFEHFIRVAIWKNIFYRDASAVFKNQSLVFFSARSIDATRFITIMGVGTSVNCLQVILFT